jgi:hypothetical protein
MLVGGRFHLATQGRDIVILQRLGAMTAPAHAHFKAPDRRASGCVAEQKTDEPRKLTIINIGDAIARGVRSLVRTVH